MCIRDRCLSVGVLMCRYKTVTYVHTLYGTRSKPLCSVLFAIRVDKVYGDNNRVTKTYQDFHVGVEVM